MDCRLVYITTADLDEARHIGRELVSARLAACANIVEGMKSMFWWEDQVQEGSETILIVKTRADLVEDLVAKVNQLHSYDVPCVVALPIAEGNPDFLRWIQEETRS